jgi:ATP-dependent RNA circularization protein (DNA/RNA ligase family)
MLTKYPSTWHLPWSENYKSTTDKVLADASHFIGQHVVVTEKMDGENTTIYHGGKCHARSLDSGYHKSRGFVRKIAGEVGYKIPKGWRVCGENMYAKHSIHYSDLKSYFLVFSVWNDENVCLSWTDTLTFCDEIGLTTVPMMYWGTWTQDTLKELNLDEERQEGYVVRLSQAFCLMDFKTSLAKYVRKNHIQTDEHWLRQPLVKNLVVSDESC